MIVLPLSNAEGAPLFEVSHDVAGVPLTFVFDWLDMAQRWRLEIRDAQGIVLATATHVVANYPFVVRRRASMPEVLFIFWREYGDADPGLLDFDDSTVVLQAFVRDDEAFA